MKQETTKQKLSEEKKASFRQIIKKGNKINKAFSQHLDKYITQYNKTGNVGL